MDQGSVALLAPGERLLWEGRPDPAKLLAPGDIFLIPFYAVFLIFSVTWLSLVLNGGPPAFFAVIGGAFVVIGLYASVGRFAVKYVGKRGTTYLLTDRRAVMRTPWSTRDVWLASALVESRLSRSGAHLSVIFTPTGLTRSGLALMHNWQSEQLRNTGMDLFAPGLSPAFYDVSDVDGLQRGLRAALDGRDRTLPPYGS